MWFKNESGPRCQSSLFIQNRTMGEGAMPSRNGGDGPRTDTKSVPSAATLEGVMEMLYRDWSSRHFC